MVSSEPTWHMSRVQKRVSKFVNFKVQKVQKPDLSDSTINEVGRCEEGQKSQVKAWRGAEVRLFTLFSRTSGLPVIFTFWSNRNFLPLSHLTYELCPSLLLPRLFQPKQGKRKPVAFPFSPGSWSLCSCVWGFSLESEDFCLESEMFLLEMEAFILNSEVSLLEPEEFFIEANAISGNLGLEVRRHSLDRNSLSV